MRLTEQAADLPLVVVERPGLVEHRDDVGGFRPGQVAPPDAVQHRPLGRGGDVEGERHDLGRLSFAEVIAHRLAQPLFVADEAEGVIAQLERLAERTAEAVELIEELGRPFVEVVMQGRPSWRGRTIVYSAVLNVATCRAVSWSSSPAAAARMSRYWPRLSSMRSSSQIRRAAGPTRPVSWSA